MTVYVENRAEDVMVVSLISDMMAYDVLHDLTADTSEGNRTVVGCVVGVSLLENGGHLRFFPVTGYLSTSK